MKYMIMIMIIMIREVCRQIQHSLPAVGQLFHHFLFCAILPSAIAEFSLIAHVWKQNVLIDLFRSAECRFPNFDWWHGNLHSAHRTRVFCFYTHN